MEERPPFGNAAELRAAHESLLQLLDAAWKGDEAADAVSRYANQILDFINRAAATGATLADLDDRTGCQSLLDYWSSMARSAGMDLPRSRLARFDAARLPELPDDACPYVGLEAFRSATFFFGREVESQRLLARVEQNPIVVVRGASGSGKSSLLLAGTLPKLRELGRWRIAEAMVPGTDPVERLVATLAVPLSLPIDFATRLRENPALLADAATEGLPILVVIDQFEEVFTLCAADERNCLEAVLAALLLRRDEHRLVLTVREEFHGRMVGLSRWEPWLQREDADYPIRAMGYPELVRAIEGPAALVNLQFDRGLAGELATAVLGQPAALPLLQFALRELWNARDRNRITREVYDAVGSPVDALPRAAERFYLGLAPQTRVEVERVLTALVRVDDLLEAYRQHVPEKKLLAAGRAETPAVLALLVAKDFITRNTNPADPVVQVKHEALLRNWPRFGEWIDARRRQRRRSMALTDMANAWNRAGRPAEGLLQGWALDEAREWEGLSGLERDFLDASKAAVTRAARLKEAALQKEAEEARASAERTEALLGRERELNTKLRMMVVVGLLGLVVAVVMATMLYLKYEALQKDKDSFEDAARQTAEQTNLRIQELERENEQLLTGKATDFASAVSGAVQTEGTPRKHPTEDPAVAEIIHGSDVASVPVRSDGSVGGAESSLSSGRSEYPRLVAPISRATIYLHISSEDDRDAAGEIQAQLARYGIQVPGIQLVDPVSTSQIRYFHPEDAVLAQSIATLMQTRLRLETRPVRGYDNVPVGRLEIWFAAGAFGSPLPAPLPMPAE